MVKRRFNIALCMMFMLGMLGMHYAHAGEITIPAGYFLNINDGTLNLPEESINNAGTLQVGTGAIKLGGNWTNTGTFIPGTGDVELIGTTNQTISGANTFYNLICTSAGNQLFFEAGKIQIVTANWTAMGNAGSYLVLRSTVDGTQWHVDPAGTRNVSYVEVKDSVNSSIPPINPAVWTDQGNNVNWIVVNTAPLANAGLDQSAYVGNTVILDGSGSSDPEGSPLTYSWTFSAKPDNSTAVLTNATSVNPTFTPDKLGIYIVSLTVNDGAQNSQADTVTITALNSAPIANAVVINQSVYVGNTVTLDGSSSSDVDGDTLTYSWTISSQPENSAAVLTNATSASPTFTADKFGIYVVTLTVNDGTVNSVADTVTITTLNSAPVADAGDDQSTYVSNTVTLDGSGSSDVDGDTLAYSWTFASKPENSAATLINATSVSPTFTADKFGTYVISLTVNDGTVNSVADTVTITTSNSAPVANAGPDQSPYVTETVTLNGAGSSDVDGDLLTYTWAFTAKPQDSNAELNDVHAVNPTFTVDKAGTYVVSLIVNDGTVDSQAETVTISTLNSAPVAVAGPDQSPHVTGTVTLDGSGSTDVDGDLLTYTWAFTSKPDGSTATLSDTAVVNPSFTVDKAGTYVVSLIVNDGTVDSQADTVTISTLNSAPMADAGADQSPHVTEVVTLNGAGSTDVDGDLLTYMWAFTARPQDSNAELSDVHAVNPTFTVDKAGTYVVSLVVNDGTVDSNQSDTVTISTLNSAPVANAGTDQMVYVNDPVTLDGSGSTDVDGDLLIYTWAFTAKPADSTATLNDPHAVNPTFTVDKAGTYVVSLIVNDGTVDSQPDTVVVSTINTVPISDAGPDQLIIHIGSTVQLNGSQSYDLEGDAITCQWAFTSKPAGSNASLSNADSATPTFVADVRGEYVIPLVVTDGMYQSDPDTVVVNFTNITPVAHAGTGQSVYVGDTVTLDGSGSTDANGDTLSYTWAFTSVPAGSSATIANPTGEVTSFVPDIADTYVVQLIVNDGTVDSDPVTIVIQASSEQTVAIEAVQNCIAQVSLLSTSVFKNANMQNTMINKFNAVIANIEAGNYADALGQLQNDILNKTDGCANSNNPDKNDWITTCPAQGSVYPSILVAIDAVEALMQ